MNSTNFFSTFNELEKEYVLPSSDLIFHTCGHRNPRQFMESAWNHSAHFLVINNAISGNDFSNYHRVLDFGCGAGRLLQFLPFNKSAEVFACDVSSECIENVKQNYDWVNAEVSGLMPPISYSDSFFDCIYSFSVFSHLSQPVENIFLDDLVRIGKKGCIYIISFHGGVWQSRLSDEEILSLEMNGFHFKKVYGDDAFPEYYECSHHTWEYIQETWSNYFEIVEIVKGGDIRNSVKNRLPENSYSDLFSNMKPIGQDILIARKR